MAPRKKAVDNGRSAAAAGSEKSSVKPLKKLSSVTSFSYGPSKVASGSRSAALPPPVGTSRGKGKRKADVVELDSDGDEVIDVDSSDDERPRLLTRVDKGKWKAAEKRSFKSAAGPQEEHLWTDLYAPDKMDDLAINKKKIGEVRDWLSEALPSPSTAPRSSQASRISRYRRIVVLTGPAGGGKTSCIKAIAHEMDCDLVEWVDGFEEWGMGTGDSQRESTISRFEGFLVRSTIPSIGSASAATSSSSSSHVSSRRKILLADSLPNLSHSDTRADFQALLQQFGSVEGGAPLVIIISDSGETGRASEGWGERGKEAGWSWREILGKTVMGLAGVRIVNFNPVPPTTLAKALNRILPLAIPRASLRPPKDAIQLIVHSSQGDVRAAVNALQFLCRARVRAPVADKSAKKATGKGSRGGKPPRGTDKALRSLLDALTRREQSLALFHALGKVLWNKRLGDPKEEEGDEEDYSPLPVDQIPLPRHLQASERRHSKVDVEALYKDAPVDTSLFNLYLHQNYPVFCTDIDECAESIDALSRSDSLKTDDDMWQSSSIAIAYAFNTTVRGLLASLPSPMPRHGQKVYKPDWFAAFREQRENEESVDEISRWVAGSGLGMGAGGQISRKVLTTQVIPELRYLDIPPSYPASLPDLTILDYIASSDSRSALNLQTILNSDDVALDSDEAPGDGLEPDGSGQVELVEGGMERKRGMTKGMFVAREEVELALTKDDEEDGEEVSGDEIGEFDD